MQTEIRAIRGQIIRDHLEKLLVSQSNVKAASEGKAISDALAFDSALAQLSIIRKTNATHEGGTPIMLPGALTGEDLCRFSGLPKRLDRAAEEALVAELDSTIESIANFFCSAREECSEQPAWADIPNKIQACRQEIMADEVTVEEQYRRIQHLVKDVNEIHPRLQKEMERIITTMQPVVDGKLAASSELLATTIETTLLKLSIMRATAYNSLYGHVSQANTSVTMTQALAAAHGHLESEEEELKKREQTIDHQLEEYRKLLELVEGPSGSFTQIVEDWSQVQRETEECRRDLRRLGWTGD